MTFLSKLKRPLRAIAAPACFLAVTGYFVWSVTQGNRGLVAFAERQDLLHQVETANAVARADRDMWQTRVSGLRSDRLSPDTLDERARAMLNLAEPNDIIVQYSPKEKLF